MYRLRPVSINEEYALNHNDSVYEYSLLVDNFIIGETLQEVIESLFEKYGSFGSLMLHEKNIGIRYDTTSEDGRSITRTMIFTFSSGLTPNDIVFLQSSGFDLVRHI